MSFQCLGDGLYRLRGRFYHRPTLPSGRRTYRALRPRPVNQKSARVLLQKLRFGDNFGVLESVTLGTVLREYHKAGYPDRHREKRTGKALSQEKSRALTLVKYWDKFPVAKLGAAAFDAFADWRARHSKEGFTGRRAAELDLNSLRNAVRWSVRKGLLSFDPFERGLSIPRYRKEKDIRHCREVAPRSGDELHSLALHLFENGRSVVLGWLTLITAMVGVRVSEITRFQLDAAEGEPGHIDWQENILWLRRAKKGTHNYFRIHPLLKTCLEAFFQWRRALKGAAHKSPYWFPGKNPAKAIQEQSLSHSLHRAGLLLFKEPRTAHGLRSMYVTVRRSMGVSDSEIALEIGQTSGGREIVRTYGEATPKKVSWLPSDGKPAWELVTAVSGAVHPPPAPHLPGPGKLSGKRPVAPGSGC